MTAKTGSIIRKKTILTVTLSDDGHEKLERLVRKLGKPRSRWSKHSKPNVSAVVEFLINNAYSNYFESLPLFTDNQ